MVFDVFLLTNKYHWKKSKCSKEDQESILPNFFYLLMHIYTKVALNLGHSKKQFFLFVTQAQSQQQESENK